jgi:hypothetical protein
MWLGWLYIVERIHKSIKLEVGDFVKVVGGYGGQIFYGRHNIVKIDSIIRKKDRLLITGLVMASNIREDEFGIGNAGSRAFYVAMFRNKQGQDKVFRLTKDEALIELV